MDRLRDSIVLPWILAVIGFPIGGVLAQQLAGPAATVPAAVVSGALVGVAQGALLMRAGVPNAWAWIPVTAVAWAVGWLITASVGVALPPGWPIYGLSGALASQVITGVALWRLVPSRDRLRAMA